MRWLSLLLLNMPGLYDEALIIGAFVYWLGPQDVAYSARHTWRVWIQPKVGPYLEQAGVLHVGRQVFHT